MIKGLYLEALFLSAVEDAFNILKCHMTLVPLPELGRIHLNHNACQVCSFIPKRVIEFELVFE